MASHSGRIFECKALPPLYADVAKTGDIEESFLKGSHLNISLEVKIRGKTRATVGSGNFVWMRYTSGSEQRRGIVLLVDINRTATHARVRWLWFPSKDGAPPLPNDAVGKDRGLKHVYIGAQEKIVELSPVALVENQTLPMIFTAGSVAHRFPNAPVATCPPTGSSPDTYLVCYIYDETTSELMPLRGDFNPPPHPTALARSRGNVLIWEMLRDILNNARKPGKDLVSTTRTHIPVEFFAHLHSVVGVQVERYEHKQTVTSFVPGPSAATSYVQRDINNPQHRILKVGTETTVGGGHTLTFDTKHALGNLMACIGDPTGAQAFTAWRAARKGGTYSRTYGLPVATEFMKINYHKGDARAGKKNGIIIKYTHGRCKMSAYVNIYTSYDSKTLKRVNRQANN